MKKEHILVIRFSALGDVAMVVPVVYTLAHTYPDIRITVLSRPFARQLFEDLAPNVAFMAADVKNDYRGMKGLNRLYRRLAAKQFTAVADLHAVLRSNYLRMRFNLGRYRVEHVKKHRQDRRRLVASEGKKILKQLPSPFENYSDVFRRLGYPIGDISFHSVFASGSRSTVTDGTGSKPAGDLSLLPSAIGQKRSWERWIGIAPFAAHEGKTYPVEMMETVVRRLVEIYPKARIFLFGRGKKEDEVYTQWTSQMSQCLNVGQHVGTLYEELIVMSHLDVMVSMDSANMHLASLTATPVVSIWGATHPMAGFMGYAQSDANVVQVDMACRPCSIFGKKACKHGDYPCMRGISPDTIVDKVKAVIEASQDKQAGS